MLSKLSHPAWVRGLKLQKVEALADFFESHPAWVRGLKQCSQRDKQQHAESHPAWVRGLKLYSFDYFLLHLRRTLRGCVD